MSNGAASLTNDLLSFASTTTAASAINSGSKTVTSLSSNSKASSYLGTGAENINAGLSLKNKLTQLEKFQSNAIFRKILPDGRIRYYGAEKIAKTPGPTKGSCRVLEWDPRRGQTRSWYESHDHFGRVNRVHPKDIHGQSVSSQHYPPIHKELNL